jgi:hypothetical protein
MTPALSPLEATLYSAVTEYVQEEFNHADQLNSDRKNTVGFALTILQRRLASSPEAIYQSLKRPRQHSPARFPRCRRHLPQRLYPQVEPYIPILSFYQFLVVFAI